MQIDDLPKKGRRFFCLSAHTLGDERSIASETSAVSGTVPIPRPRVPRCGQGSPQEPSIVPKREKTAIR
jgi:hypothetical protein